MGVWPLVSATGPGANSRFSIGLMITSGMLVGALFTLFIIPVFYLPFFSAHGAARQRKRVYRGPDNLNSLAAVR